MSIINPNVSSIDYILAFIGAILLSVATIINILFKGRVTGMSGISYSIWTGHGELFCFKSIIII